MASVVVTQRRRLPVPEVSSARITTSVVRATITASLSVSVGSSGVRLPSSPSFKLSSCNCCGALALAGYINLKFEMTSESQSTTVLARSTA
jgi:hypothetical protein